MSDNNTVWVVEVKHTWPKNAQFKPVTGFPGISSMYLVRQSARAAAKMMEQTNQYNRPDHKTVVYRAAKYIRSGE